MDIMKNIQDLLDSEISGPMIEDATGVSKMMISNYRNKKTDFRVMELRKAVALNDFWLTQPTSLTGDVNENENARIKLNIVKKELEELLETL